MSIVPPRIAERPDPASWRADELLTLDEAAALFWPQGPLSVSSLRTAVRDRRLAVARIAGKLLVTPRAIVEMSHCSLLPSPDQFHAEKLFEAKNQGADSTIQRMSNNTSQQSRVRAAK